MSIGTSTNYGFIRVREQSPDAKDWAVTDGNFEAISLTLKAVEQHRHTGTTAITFPGYDVSDPPNPHLPTTTVITTGGTLTPGVNVGVRLAYVNAAGLETDASPEVTQALGVIAARPLTPLKNSVQAASPGLTGGTYVYVITKKNANGETLSSDVLPVDIGYDTTYSVTLGFNAVSSYTDGTTAINIYRAAGLNSSYQLLTTITASATTTYTDAGAVPPATASITPPTVSTFNANNKVRISWSTLTHPTAATGLRVYVTQQTGIWGTQALLAEMDLTVVTPPTYVEYLGSEVLLSGYPKAVSQIPSSPPKLDVTTESTMSGTWLLSHSIDFNSYQAINLRVENRSGVPSVADNGDIYYDTSINNMRAYINGTWVNWGTSPTSTYTHPTEEAGGHVAANIKFNSGSAITAKTVFDTMRDPTTGARKHITGLYKVTGPLQQSTAATSAALLPDMDITTVTPFFTGQFAKATFTGHFTTDVLYAVLTVAIEYDGSTIEETIRPMTAGAINFNHSVSIPLTIALGTAGGPKQFRVLWWVTSGTAISVAGRRTLTVEVLA